MARIRICRSFCYNFSIGKDEFAKKTANDDSHIPILAVFPTLTKTSTPAQTPAYVLGLSDMYINENL